MASRALRRQDAGLPAPTAPTARAGTRPGDEPGRRTFLRRALTGGAALGTAGAALTALAPAAVAQTTGSIPGTTPGSTPGTSGVPAADKAPIAGADLAFARYARTVALALDEVYGQAAETGKLKAEAVDEVRLFAHHHRDHAARFAEFTASEAPGEPNQALIAALAPRVAGAATEKDLIGVLQSIEESAAATYKYATETIEDWQFAGAVAAIAATAAQQATAWSLRAEPDLAAWLGQLDKWVPVLQGVDGRWPEAQFPVAPA